MEFKVCYMVAISLALACLVIENKAQDDEVYRTGDEVTLITTKQTFENLTGHANAWVLVPSNVNLNGSNLDLADYNLFKLNTDLLFNQKTTENDDQEPTYRRSGRASRATTGQRDARKMNILRNIMNRPKVSPLYLVNGTVCRFVNSQPICTTLSTTGLLRK